MLRKSLSPSYVKTGIPSSGSRLSGKGALKVQREYEHVGQIHAYSTTLAVPDLPSHLFRKTVLAFDRLSCISHSYTYTHNAPHQMRIPPYHTSLASEARVERNWWNERAYWVRDMEVSKRPSIVSCLASMCPLKQDTHTHTHTHTHTQTCTHSNAVAS